ncbi:MAG TPA: VCBS repeat-containing protein [Terriglobales bacterium]|jgi:hypothetical protein|nr:VCBS repeat-containing protein [Terriglobales bacterium]
MFDCGHLSAGARESASSLFCKRFVFLAVVLVSGALLSVRLSAEVTKVTFTKTGISVGSFGPSFSIVPGDFNKDGILDLVTINATSLSFYEGLGDGKYAAPVTQTLSTSNPLAGPSLAADFNGDGRLDLAIAAGPLCCGEPNGAVTILLGNGDGTFTQGTNLTFDGNASTIALADFNGDHKPDIAVSDAGNIFVFLGNGDGTFTLGYSNSNGGGNVLVAGDFNGDGKQDLVFADSNYIGLYLGDGKGGFAYPAEAPLAGVTSLAVGDFFNTHSYESLVALASTGIPEDDGIYTYTYSLRYEDGGLIIESSNLVAGATSGGPTYIAGGDLNGDFNFDVFISGGGYYEGPASEYMLGNGNGTFQELQKAGYVGDVSVLEFPIIRDLNLDSRHDVAMAYLNLEDDTGGAEVLLNTNATPNCAPPPANKLSVNICAPTSGETVGSTFTFSAAGNAFSGSAQRMQLYIDGTKVAEFLEDQLAATVSLSAGVHTAKFVVTDSFGTEAEKSVSFTAD